MQMIANTRKLAPPITRLRLRVADAAGRIACHSTYGPPATGAAPGPLDGGRAGSGGNGSVGSRTAGSTGATIGASSASSDWSAASSALVMSAAEANRRAGSFASASEVRYSSAGVNVRSGAASCSDPWSPTARPVSSSNAIAPIEYRSLRASTGRPGASSGAA